MCSSPGRCFQVEYSLANRRQKIYPPFRPPKSSLVARFISIQLTLDRFDERTKRTIDDFVYQFSTWGLHASHFEDFLLQHCDSSWSSNSWSKLPRTIVDYFPWKFFIIANLSHENEFPKWALRLDRISRHRAALIFMIDHLSLCLRITVGFSHAAPRSSVYRYATRRIIDTAVVAGCRYPE